MDSDELYPIFYAAISRGDVPGARDLLNQHPWFLRDESTGGDFLRSAVIRNNVEMTALLVEFGADINAPDLDGDPEGPIVDAANEGAIDTARWLLDHGAKLNHEVDGVTRCFAIGGAARNGHLELVKLLVERGADVNAMWADQNSLSFAIVYGQREVEAYLRSQGAVEPWKLLGQAPPSHICANIEDHLKKHLGKPKSLQLQEIVTGTPSISLVVVPMGKEFALVTKGMSDLPMKVPEGESEFRYAELVIHLPKNWPLTGNALQDPTRSWPVDWLRRIARYPHEHNTWLGGSSVIFANEEPPQPLASNTKLSCLLLLLEPDPFGTLRTVDGRLIRFYMVYPIYTEERDLERSEGIRRLVELFQEHSIDTVVDLDRLNVALRQ